MKLKRLFTFVLCVIMAFSMSCVSLALPVEPYPDDYCEICGPTGIIGFSRNDKIGFFAEYYSNSDENATLLWTIEGESFFIRADDKKTSTEDFVNVRFKDESVVRLQLISTDGEVLAEDEITLKKYVDNTNFWEELPANFLLSVMVVIGVVGGTLSSIFCAIADLFAG